MYKQLIININPFETRVALLEDGSIVEFFIERKNYSNITGNIYKGVVQRVLPGMQAAFIDIGLEHAAFIHVDDLVFPRVSMGEDETEELSSTEQDDAPVFQKKRLIEDLITEGQALLVQVSKSPIGTKGARVTSQISLPGRLLVLLPDSNHIGVSRRIEDEEERQRLKLLVSALLKENFGYILRTASEGAQADKFSYEMLFLENLWKKILRRFDYSPTPFLLHQELDVTLRAVRDLLIQDADHLVIDSQKGYEQVVMFIEEFMPGMKASVEFFQGSEPIFEAFNIEGDISRALQKKIWLKSGGYIVIEHTEALVAIDVNTGRYVGKHNLEETILKTNLEAVKEIAYQIRLRDIGGIIIIDFIDMEKSLNQEKVFNAFCEALKKDRSKNHVLPMSQFGLIQMTRKRTKKSLTRMLCEPCAYCDGEGVLLSRQSICQNIYREILRDYHDHSSVKTISLSVHPHIADLLHGEANPMVAAAERQINKQIVIYPDPHLYLGEYQLVESMASAPTP